LLDRFDSTKNVFCQEWAKDHQQRAPVGPGHYDVKGAEALLSKKTIITFPKNSRALDPILKKSDSPGPTSYDTLPEPYFFLGTDNSRNLKSTSQFLK
jgi:hypothetical protein